MSKLQPTAPRLAAPALHRLRPFRSQPRLRDPVPTDEHKRRSLRSPGPSPAVTKPPRPAHPLARRPPSDGARRPLRPSPSPPAAAKPSASWFADDAVTLNNGRPAVLGRASIAAQADWDPKTYQLTWTPQGAQMGPSNDMGFTWGHYEGHSKDQNGNPVVISGRYFTVWKKMPDGTWKVAMDASANEPPASGRMLCPSKTLARPLHQK